MKKILSLVLVISVFTLILPNCFTLAINDNAGVTLKSMGILKGYTDGTLKEDKFITQGEYLALLSRIVRKVGTSQISNLVSPKNKLDIFINNAYRKYVLVKNKIIDIYYSVLQVLPGYEVIPGVSKESWFFKDALYLKRIGFQFKEGFDLNQKANEADIYGWFLEALGGGDNSSSIQEGDSLTETQRMQILMVEHGLPYNDFSPNKFMKRAEVFDLVLNVLNK
jgi:hypothetical protein